MANRSRISERYYKKLSKPKSIPAGFLEDRRSIYWDNKIPSKEYTKTTAFVLTARQEQLVYSKRLHPDYQGDRPSPIWTVSPNARRATASQRLTQLAEPKQLHPDYQPSREVDNSLSVGHVYSSSSLQKPQVVKTIRPPKTTCPSSRLLQLSKHKPYLARLDLEPIKEADISPAAKHATASPRVLSLAEPKHINSHFQPCRDVQWKVRKESLAYEATELISKLAAPKNHGSAHEDFNSQAFRVRRASLMAHATPRLCDLAIPPQRKIRSIQT